MSVPAFRYRAFLSYSHANRKEAAWLHRRLEGYRFPAGARTEEGIAPERLTPVFRDREELRAGASLNTALQSALREAECLIILCSPQAAASVWVDREIVFFQQLGRGDRIFALIIAGDPGVPENCFPPALRATGGAELLAADLRRSADGRPLALSKLIAGLARVPLDDLVRREQQRSIRRLQWLASGALALVLTFAGLGTALYFQRREAIRQRDLARLVRDQAQELNTFFITDLRTKLRAVGRLDLLDDATRRVLAYHAALPAELANDPAVLRARAMAMDYAGQIKMARGDPAGAAELLEKSRVEWAKLIQRGDGGAGALQGYAVNCKMLGEALNGQSPERELQVYAEGLALLGALRVTSAEGGARLARLRSLLQTATGKTLYHRGDSHKALEHLDAGAALAKESVEGDPPENAGWKQAVIAFTELASYYLHVRDFEAALKQAGEAQEAARVLVQRDADDADARNLLGGAQAVLLMVHSARKDWPSAEQAARGQLEARQLVSRRDPQNPGATASEGKAHDDLAFVLRNQDKMETAVEEFSRAIEIFAGLIQQYPSRNDWRRDLALVFKRRGDLWFRLEEWDETLKDYERCRYMRARVAAAMPEDATALLQLANIRLASGEVFWKQGKLADAAATFTEARKLLDAPMLAADNPEAAMLREETVRVMRDLARASEAKQPPPSALPATAGGNDSSPHHP